MSLEQHQTNEKLWILDYFEQIKISDSNKNFILKLENNTDFTDLFEKNDYNFIVVTFLETIDKKELKKWKINIDLFKDFIQNKIEWYKNFWTGEKQNFNNITYWLLKLINQVDSSKFLKDIMEKSDMSIMNLDMNENKKILQETFIDIELKLKVIEKVKYKEDNNLIIKSWVLVITPLLYILTYEILWKLEDLNPYTLHFILLYYSILFIISEYNSDKKEKEEFKIKSLEDLNIFYNLIKEWNPVNKITKSTIKNARKILEQEIIKV